MKYELHNAWICILGMSSLGFVSLHADHITARVFIHGTIMPVWGLLSAKPVCTGSLAEHHWYTRIINAVRKNRTTEHSDLVYGTGLVDVTDLIVQPTPRVAAHHILHGFDRVSAQTPNHPTSCKYFTFSWNGLLSEAHREQASEELFHALINLQKSLQAQGHTVSFQLYTHSHGAQLALYLPVIAQQHDVHDLAIELLVLSGAPLYRHKAQHALSGMFSTIINVYAPGDAIQPIDRFSTPGRTCVRTFAQLGITSQPQVRIVDVRITINQAHRAVGHPTFFVLDRYYTNRADATVLAQLGPLPLVTWYPLLLQHIPTLPDHCHTVELDVYTTSSSTLCARMTHGTDLLYEIPLPDTLLHELTHKTHQGFGGRFVSELQKVWLSIKNLVCRHR